MLFYLLGYIRHFLRPGDKPSEVERWTQVAYTIGLFLLAALAWLIGIFGWGGSFTIGVWWASAISIFLAGSAGVMVFILRKQGRDAAQIQQGWFWRLATRIGTTISAVLRLNWLDTFFRFLFDWLQKLIHLMTEMLEGAGGILWVFVLLVLLITVVQASVK